MCRMVAAGFLLLCMVAPVWAAETDRFDPDQPFEQALAANLLRSLLHQAFDKLEDHIEMSGTLNPDQTDGDRGSHLRFKFYPEGRSKSDQHFSAEGWFHSAPEAGRHDWHFKFKLPEDRSRESHLQPEPPL